MDIVQAIAHLKDRHRQLANRWIRSWPKWTNKDFVSVSILIGDYGQAIIENAELRARVAPLDALVREVVEANRGGIGTGFAIVPIDWLSRAHAELASKPDEAFVESDVTGLALGMGFGEEDGQVE